MSPRRILIVDDDAPILFLVATILRRENYLVDTATGGRDALAKIELTPYDVIVLDLMMPEVSGFDVLSSLQARLPKVRCVVLMSAASSFEMATSNNPNVFAALRKPFDNIDLVRAVRGCIEATCGPAGPVLPLKPVAVAA